MLAVSFRMRKWIGQRGWRRLHYASFVAFILAVGHALVVGTDLHGGGGPILAAIVLGPTLWLVLLRVLAPSPKAQLRLSRRCLRRPVADDRVDAARGGRPQLDMPAVALDQSLRDRQPNPDPGWSLARQNRSKARARWSGVSPGPSSTT